MIFLLLKEPKFNALALFQILYIASISGYWLAGYCLTGVENDSVYLNVFVIVGLFDD